MKDALPPNATLVLIDVQKAFDDPSWGTAHPSVADTNMARLLEAWRRATRPVVHVKHDSIEAGSRLSPDAPGNAIKDFANPHYGERLFHKHMNSAFIGTSLETFLRGEGHNTLVMVGWTTDHCVSTTARMAGNMGFKTYVVADACATHDRKTHTGTTIPAETMHEAALASLHGEFATVCTTDEMLAALRERAAAAKE